MSNNSTTPIPDPELIALPAPPKKLRWLAAGLMTFTALVSLVMCGMLWGEVVYAMKGSSLASIGDLVQLRPEQVAHGYVEGEGLLSTKGAIRYERPFEGDSFRLHPVAGNEKVWVEIRVPQGMEGPRFVPPVSFAGRLVPATWPGLRYLGITGAVARETGLQIPSDAWLLLDGTSPRSSRWAVALFGLLVAFASWSVANTFRIIRPVR